MVIIDVQKVLKGETVSIFLFFYSTCFLCRPSDSTVSEDAGIEPRTVATLAIGSQTLYRLDLTHNSARCHPQLG